MLKNSSILPLHSFALIFIILILILTSMIVSTFSHLSILLSMINSLNLFLYFLIRTLPALNATHNFSSTNLLIKVMLLEKYFSSLMHSKHHHL